MFFLLCTMHSFMLLELSNVLLCQECLYGYGVDINGNKIAVLNLKAFLPECNTRNTGYLTLSHQTDLQKTNLLMQFL